MKTRWPTAARRGNPVKVRTDKRPEVQSLEFCVGQLRHAYTHLCASGPLVPPEYWTVTQRTEFARGLISPVIQRLEALIVRLDTAGGPPEGVR